MVMHHESGDEIHLWILDIEHLDKINKFIHDEYATRKYYQILILLKKCTSSIKRNLKTVWISLQ